MARIGRMDRKIDILRATITRDEYNAEVHDWQKQYQKVWANVRQQSGKEALQADQVVASDVVVFTVHYLEVLPTDRVKYNGRTYDIQSTNEIGRRKQLEIIAHGRDNTASGG